MARVPRWNPEVALEPEELDKKLSEILKKELKTLGIVKVDKLKSNTGSMSKNFTARDKDEKKDLFIKAVIVDKEYDGTTSPTNAGYHNTGNAFFVEVVSLEKLQNSKYCVKFYGAFEEPYFNFKITNRYDAYCFIQPKYELWYGKNGFDTKLFRKWEKKYNFHGIAAWVALCILKCIKDIKDAGIGPHRDIKPGNILIEVKDPDQMFSCKFLLADFGIAYVPQKFLLEKEKECGVNFCFEDNYDKDNKLANLGTEAYKPERSNLAHDWRDDQYMLAKTLCKFYNVLKTEKRKLVLKEDWKNSDFYKEKYGIHDVILKMMSDDPNDRYQDIDELIKIFDNILLKITDEISPSNPLVIEPEPPKKVQKDRKKVVPTPIKRPPGTHSSQEAYGQMQNKPPVEKKNPGKNPAGFSLEDLFAAKEADNNFLKLSPEKKREQIYSELRKKKYKDARKHIDLCTTDKSVLMDRARGLSAYFENNEKKALGYFKEIYDRDTVSCYFCFSLSKGREEKFRYLNNAFGKMNKNDPLYPVVCYNLYEYYRDMKAVNDNLATIKKHKKRIKPEKLFEIATSLK